MTEPVSNAYQLPSWHPSEPLRADATVDQWNLRANFIYGARLSMPLEEAEWQAVQEYAAARVAASTGGQIIAREMARTGEAEAKVARLREEVARLRVLSECPDEHDIFVPYEYLACAREYRSQYRAAWMGRKFATSCTSRVGQDAALAGYDQGRDDFAATRAAEEARDG